MRLLTKNSSILSKAISLTLLYSFILTNIVAVGAFAANNNQTSSNSSATSRFTTDLTQLGRDGRLRENLNLEADTLRLIKVLAGGGQRQPVIVDEKGEDQDFVVEQLAMRIANGNVDNKLAGVSILKLETDNVFSSASSVAEVSARIEAVMNEVIASGGKKILFVDELTNVLEAGDAGAKLIENIANGKIRIIGGSSKAAYAARIENSDYSAFFDAIVITGKAYAGATDQDMRTANQDGFRGDNVSSDIRDMMAQDPTGSRRIDVILQARDADNAALRSLLASGEARIHDRVGGSDTLVVNLPLRTVGSLSRSGLVNYVSPDRPLTVTGHVEEATGAAVVRAQAALNGRAAYTLDGSSIGVAVVDSGIQSTHKGFKNGGASRVVANVNFTTSTLS
ncbi:MAG: hypothetical protein WBD27_12350, partial [Pyrinomonadaceae bacterium]